MKKRHNTHLSMTSIIHKLNKCTFAFTLLIIVLISSSILEAQTHYTLSSEDVTVSNGWLRTCSYDFSANKEGTVLSIPSVLDGETIETITNSSYLNQGIFEDKNIIEVILPNTCHTIGTDAFKNNNITSITLPRSLRKLNGASFRGNKITQLTIPSNLESIGWYDFADNEIDTIIYKEGSQLIQVGRSAFANNPLAKINLPQTAIGGFEGWYTEDREALLVSNDKKQYITDKTKTHIAFVPYTLTAEDVVVSNNTITYYKESDLPKKYIIIPSKINGQTITCIGSSSFADKDLWKIEFPSTLTRINSYSCRQNYFEEILIPESVSIIGGNAFASNDIKHITLPSKVLSIGDQAFVDNPLASVTFAPNSQVISIGEFAFAPSGEEKQLDSIILPKIKVDNFVTWVNSEGEYISNEHGDFIIKNFKTAYEPAYEYTLTDNDVVIEDGIITACTHLGGNIITIPSTLQNQIIKEIANHSYNGVFEDKGLVGVTLPSTLESIGGFAFYNNKITHLDLGKDSQVRYLGDHAFYANNKLAPIPLPSHTKNGFWGWMDASGLDVALTNGIYEVSNYMHSYSAKFTDTLRCEDVTMDNGTITHCSHLGSARLIIPEELCGQTVIGIGDQNTGGLFKSKGIVDIQIPQSIQYIGKRAFASNFIKSLSLPTSLEEIGEATFSQNLITELHIPANVVKIGSSAFTQNQLDTVAFEEGSHLELLESHVFFQNENLKSFVLPKLEQDNFYGWLQWQENTLVEETEKGYTASKSDRSYMAIIPYILNEDDVTIEDGSITNSSIWSIGMIRIPDSIAGQEVKAIGSNVFSQKWIYHVVLPNTLKSIGNRAFSNNHIGEVKIPSSVTIIKNRAFSSCKISKIKFDKASQLLVIESEAFASNELESMKLPKHNNAMFRGWVDDQLNEISSNASGIYEASDFSKTYVARVPQTLTNDDVTVVNGRIISYNQQNGTELNLPSELGVKRIGPHAFSRYYLLSVTLPVDLTLIEEEAFSHNWISYFTPPNQLRTIGASAFSYNKLQNIDFSHSQVTHIGKECFSQNENLLSINLPEHSNSNFQGWWEYAPYTKLNLVGNTVSNFEPSYTAKIPYTLDCTNSTFDSDTLIDTYGLGGTLITIPEELCGIEVNRIGLYAFKERGLFEVHLPTSLESIDGRAFYGNHFNIIYLPQKYKNKKGENFLGWYNEESQLLEYNNGDTIVNIKNIGIYAAYSKDKDPKVIQASPNPNNGTFTIEASSTFETESIEVLSIDKLCQSFKTSSDQQSHKIDISDLPDGMYFIRAIAKDGKDEIIKIIKLKD